MVDAVKKAVQEFEDSLDQVGAVELGYSIFAKDVLKRNSKTLTQTRSTQGASASGQHTVQISL